MVRAEKFRSEIISLLALSRSAATPARARLADRVSRAVAAHGLEQLFADYLSATFGVGEVSELGDMDLRRAAAFAARLATTATAGSNGTVSYLRRA